MSSPEFFDPNEEIEKHRHNLPHWQQEHRWIFVTWRLADSLPQSLLTEWKEGRAVWIKHHPEPWDDGTEEEYHRRFTARLDDALDSGHGSCCLRDPSLSEIVANALHHFDKKRYELSTFVVMPNHVHILFRPLENHRLPDIMHSWKRFTAREINKALGQEGTLWQPDYWDRLIRSQEHFDWITRYITNNPKNLSNGSFHLWKAGL
jgi:REP element-mobilizing transposase RayT